MDESLATNAASPYPLPSSCEYCGASSIKDCPEKCKRPKFYLSKKRPPFLAASSLKKEWCVNHINANDASLEAFDTASSTISNFNDEKKDWMSEIGWRGWRTNVFAKSKMVLGMNNFNSELIQKKPKRRGPKKCFGQKGSFGSEPSNWQNCCRGVRTEYERVAACNGL